LRLEYFRVIRQRKPSNGHRMPGVFSGDSQHITFDGVTPGKNYTLSVRALGCSTGQSDWSDQFARGDVAASSVLTRSDLSHISMTGTDFTYMIFRKVEQLSYEITDVPSKYVSAFQESMSNFTTWFPDNPALNRFEVKEQDVSGIFRQLDRHYAAVSEALGAYRKSRMPFALFAELTGRSYLEVWTGMVNDSRGRVFSAIGLKEDTNSEAEILAKANEIVFGSFESTDHLAAEIDIYPIKAF
jgi:hypothetical protein